MQSNNNILIAQGGGPTNVINQSLVGIINGENNKNSNIIGAINGVRGIIDNNFLKLDKTKTYLITREDAFVIIF